MDRAGLAGCERDVQQIALLQQLLKKRQIGGHIDLAGLGQLSFLKEPVKAGQRLGVAAHVVIVLRAVHHIGVKQHGDISALHVGVGQVHSGAAAQRELSFHFFLHSMRKSRSVIVF